MSNQLLVGIITKPQGIKGEVKVKVLADSPYSLSQLKQVYVDQTEYKVLNVRISNDSLFLSLRGIADRTEAELLRDKQIFADKEQIIKDEKSFFIVDVIGCRVYLDDGTLVGAVVDILSGKNDVYYVKGEKGTAVFPLIKDLLPDFDIENKKITVNAKRFLEVVFYED